MTVEQAVALIEQLGLPTVIILAVAWFVSHDIWPFAIEKFWPYVVQRIESGDKEREKINQERQDDRQSFLMALEKRDKAMSTALEELADSQTKRTMQLTQALETLSEKQENRDNKLAATLEVRDTRLVNALNQIAESMTRPASSRASRKPK